MSQVNKMKFGLGVRVLDTPFTSISEWENWKYSCLYYLHLYAEFKPYLVPDFKFGAKTRLKPFRDLTDDDSEGKSKDQKCADVDFMLQQIAQYCPKIPHDIVRECASLEVWQVITLHNNII